MTFTVTYTQTNVLSFSKAGRQADRPSPSDLLSFILYCPFVHLVSSYTQNVLTDRQSSFKSSFIWKKDNIQGLDNAFEVCKYFEGTRFSLHFQDVLDCNFVNFVNKHKNSLA